jgi:3-methyladenine DNA glycosylase AlkD
MLALVDELVRGETHEEKTLGLLILEGIGGRGRRPFGPAEVDRWLGCLVGWAEVDCLCQSLFDADDLLGDWPAWSGLIRRLAKDANVNKRRASLVLLVRSTGRNPDLRLSDLAFETIETLKSEREIIITKAVSWLLRALMETHPAEVARYLDDQSATLPAIAVRETRAKLRTGRKAPARAAAER